MMSDNLEWSKWIYYSPAEWESEYKGLYRNSMMSAISHYAGREGDDVNWNRKLLHFSSGLHDVSFSRTGKRGLLKHGKEISRKFIGKDPQTVISKLLGDKFDASDILTWKDIFDAVMSKDFQWKAFRKEIFSLVIKDIEGKGYPIPKELKKYK